MALGLLLALGAPAQTTGAARSVEVNIAARISLMEGEVGVFNAAKKKRAVQVGDHVTEGDDIVTGGDGELHLEMEDGGFMSVRPNTNVRIVKYQAKGEDTDSVVLGLLQGSFRTVTGWIGRYNPKGYTIKTPTASIGVRGTDHEPSVIPTGSSEGEPGTYDRVYEGGSFIQTAGGRTEINANQSGFVSHRKAERPRLLTSHPRHYRVARNDGVFRTKHADVQSRIEKRREERRNAIRERLEKARAEGASRKAERAQSMREKREAAKPARENARLNRQDAAQPKRAEAKPERHEKRADRREDRPYRERTKQDTN
jgi:hypothetical protein